MKLEILISVAGLFLLFFMVSAVIQLVRPTNSVRDKSMQYLHAHNLLVAHMYCTSDMCSSSIVEDGHIRHFKCFDEADHFICGEDNASRENDTHPLP